MKPRLIYLVLIFGFLFTSCAKEELHSNSEIEEVFVEVEERDEIGEDHCNDCFQLYSLCITGNSDCETSWPNENPYITIKQLCHSGHAYFIADIPVSSGQNCMGIYLPTRNVTTFRFEKAGDCEVQVSISPAGCEGGMNMPSQNSVHFNLTRKKKAKARNMPAHCDVRCLDKFGNES